MSGNLSKLFSLEPNDLEDLITLGQGAFGRVLQMNDRQKWPQPVAIKEVFNTKVLGIDKEGEIMLSVDHPNLVKSYGYCAIGKKRKGIVMELCEGNLEQLITAKQSINQHELMLIMKQFCEGVDFLHQNHKIHRDLKPQNILFKSEKQLPNIGDHDITELQFKIGDFGLCREVEDLHTHTMTALGTPGYVAPEISDRTKHILKKDDSGHKAVRYNAKVDVYSVGKIGEKLLHHLDSGQNENVVRKFKALCGLCCKTQPKERPAMHEILSKLEKIEYGSQTVIQDNSNRRKQGYHIEAEEITDTSPLYSWFRSDTVISAKSALKSTAKTGSSIFGKKKVIWLLMIGLDNYGKTGIMYKLKLGKSVTSIPTIGFNVETVKYKNASFQVLDVPSFYQKMMSPVLRRHYKDVRGLLFLVNSRDKERLMEARDELNRFLYENDLQMASALLVLATKQDQPDAMNVSEISDKLDLHSIQNRKWHVQATCESSGDGLYEGLDWLYQQLMQ